MDDAQRESGRLTGIGGLGIHWQAWLPADVAARAVVLIAHGAAEHGGRYDWTARQLTTRGYAVYAIDHRGHGRSDGPRAYVDRLDNAVADLDALADLAAERHPGAPLVLLGHSMGGLIALAYALEHQRRLAALVLSAPLAVLDSNAATRAVARTLSAVAPRLPLYKIDGTTVSRDPSVVADYDGDPLNHRGMLPARTIGELMAGVAKVQQGLPRIELPLLVMRGTGDRLVDPRAAALVHDRAGSEDRTLIDYDGLYHEILNEPERDRVIADVADWLDARLPARAPAAA